MISLEEARRLIAERVGRLEAVEVPLAEALGAVLAEAVVADGDYPAGNRSMMDGYALAADEEPGTFPVVGEVPAGGVAERPLRRGESLRIFTGALLPEGAGRVVPQEDVRRDGERVIIDRLPDRPFVRVRGAEARAGEEILPAGARLGATELAMLAQVGAVWPRVARRPLVRHLATGEEIVDPAETPRAGQIRDTNSALFRGLFGAFGGELVQHRAGDDLERLIALGRLPSDLLLISGGAGAGDYDFGAETLRRLGYEIHFDRVNLRPGKPLTFATRGGQAAFVVPGNPVSHYVCYQVAIRLAAELLAGVRPCWDFVELELAGGEPLRPDPRETYWPARVAAEEGKLLVMPKRWSSSGDTFSLAGTNALVRVNAESPAEGRAQVLLV